MGAEASCTLTLAGKTTNGKALLETDALIFRGGELRISIPYKQVSKVVASDGILRVTWDHGVAAFALGDTAIKWAEKIRNPPSRMDKLGIKAEQRVLLIGLRDDELRAEIEARGATVATRLSKSADAIFYAANTRRDLEKLTPLQQYLNPTGAIWVIRPKGSSAISESDVMRAGKQAGLVDVKVVRYSETHTAEKFVIPVKRR
jgi:hypothetical protein